MRLSEFVTEAAPNIAQRFGSKLLAKLPYGYKSRGQVQTNTEFVRVWDKFKTWMGRSGYQFLNSVEGMKDQKPIEVDKISDKGKLWLSNNKILTSEMFKKIFAKTPHLGQAIAEEGIKSNVTLTEKQVKNILYNTIQLKASAPPPPDAGEERQKKTQEQFNKVHSELVNSISGTTSGKTNLDATEYKQIERTIKAEVSKSYKTAIDIGIKIIQLSKRYDVEKLISLWLDAVETGVQWETLKEVQTKVNLSET